MAIILDAAHRLECLQTIFRKLDQCLSLYVKEERLILNLARYKGLMPINGDAVALFIKCDYFILFMLLMKTDDV
jgi:hypothetical protein